MTPSQPSGQLPPSLGDPSAPMPAGAGDGLPRGRRLAAMTAIMLSVALATLDTAIVNTALPTMANDIGAHAASAIWIVSAYQLAMVAMLLPLASLGEIVGHRRVFIGGLMLFTVTSLACGIAWSLSTLTLARALQGLGAAAIMSVNVALIRHVYPLRMLGRGVGLNALVVGVAFTVGPTVASAILSIASWHWLFYINVPIGLVAAFLSWRTLPATGRATHRFDGIAAALCASTLAAAVLAIDTVAHDSAWTIVAGATLVALVCGTALIRRQSDHPAPMLPIDLFRRIPFALSSATSVCSFATQGLAFVALPFLFQAVLGYSQVATGFLITPWPAVVAVLAPIAGRLSDRYPPGLLGGAGLSVLAVGMIALAVMPAHPSTLDIAWRMALCGAGFGFFQSPNLRALMGSVPASRSGGASGIIASSRLLGQTIGAALVALCFNLSPHHGPVLALWLGGGFALVGCVASLLRLLPETLPSPG